MQGQLDESQKVDAGCVLYADDGSNVDLCWINLKKQKQRMCTSKDDRVVTGSCWTSGPPPVKRGGTFPVIM